MFGRRKRANDQEQAETAIAASAGEDVPPTYWLEVVQGREAALAYIRASGDEVFQAFEQYPILMLPQFPAAMEAMGRSQGDQQLAAACAQNAGALRAAQEKLGAGQSSMLASMYGSLMGRLGIALAQEQSGDRRRNLKYSIASFQAAGRAFGSGEGLGESLNNEASVWWSLADLDVDAPASMERAAQLYGEARAAFGTGPQGTQCTLNEAKTRVRSAELGFDPVANFEAAVRLYEEACTELGDSPLGTASLVGLAHARTRLNELRQPGAGS